MWNESLPFTEASRSASGVEHCTGLIFRPESSPGPLYETRAQPRPVVLSLDPARAPPYMPDPSPSPARGSKPGPGPDPAQARVLIAKLAKLIIRPGPGPLENISSWLWLLMMLCTLQRGIRGKIQCAHALKCCFARGDNSVVKLSCC